MGYVNHLKTTARIYFLRDNLRQTVHPALPIIRKLMHFICSLT